MIKEYLQDNILLADGAMGTYYSQITGEDAAFSELANETEPEVVKAIHAEYIQAGARLIRTNTFSANTLALDVSRDQVKRIIAKGYEIALQAARGREVFVAADMGPIPEMTADKKEVDPEFILDEYRFIVDAFIEAGADIFVLETLSSTDYLREVTEYIKSKNSQAFILVQFATTVDGYTRKGISISRIIKEVKAIPYIDAYGFNCGAGPAHLYQNIRAFDFSGDIVSVMPNAGYPEIVHQRTVYTRNPEYFSNIMMDVARLGVKIVGGCCGTTPLHISKMRDKLAEFAGEKRRASAPVRKVWHITMGKNDFYTKLVEGKFPVVVELDPPFDVSVEKIMEGAAVLKQNGVDAVTVADSPLARPRLNSMMLAAKIKREVGIEVIPHLCCRDHNLIGLKSLLLAGYVEGIRNLLVVTGDPIPGAEKSSVKSVFDLNSFKLMALIQEMNNELFSQDPYIVGGALNLNVQNRDAEISRMERKMENGARFFLTQPVFASEVIEYLARLKAREKVKILGGVMPIVSYKNALFLNNEIPGISIPSHYIERFRPDMDRQEAEEVGIEIAVELINNIKQHVDGLYLITPFNRVNMVVRVLKGSLL
ncbi:MAG: bifunctional homocysteine S-methyltransferase/methylenetetrahydrofolate reductase [Caldicoprobacter sp.]|uniref:Homocysteine S-methyltransferase n=1 Tax=Caldicoprobacter faecalis TaxID=937334 RepID=A0A1I5USH7_9FIRM|nr:bifunctional homocysteine S-methyltransferase/methylenetetrahydrofolate reductase [Caldicoprobacter faecalis]MBO2495006.1 bifunctional homocysteine S-methyltransferase/methylenetetrahydrofolate reductase [Clostridia bacterium]SFP97997.1 homocysteine S-methyltransferase [Caldicoprobacter faecalis]